MFGGMVRRRPLRATSPSGLNAPGTRRDAAEATSATSPKRLASLEDIPNRWIDQLTMETRGHPPDDLPLDSHARTDRGADLTGRSGDLCLTAAVVAPVAPVLPALVGGPSADRPARVHLLSEAPGPGEVPQDPMTIASFCAAVSCLVALFTTSIGPSCKFRPHWRLGGVFRET